MTQTSRVELPFAVVAHIGSFYCDTPRALAIFRILNRQTFEIADEHLSSDTWRRIFNRMSFEDAFATERIVHEQWRRRLLQIALRAMGIHYVLWHTVFYRDGYAFDALKDIYCDEKMASNSSLTRKMASVLFHNMMITSAQLDCKETFLDYVKLLFNTGRVTSGDISRWKTLSQ